jgi:hypothetical protein
MSGAISPLSPYVNLLQNVEGICEKLIAEK